MECKLPDQQVQLRRKSSNCGNSFSVVITFSELTCSSEDLLERQCAPLYEGIVDRALRWPRHLCSNSRFINVPFPFFGQQGGSLLLTAF